MVPALTKSMDSSRIEKGKNERRKRVHGKDMLGKKFKDICCMILGKHTGQIYEKIRQRFLQSKSGFRRIYRNTADHASCFLIFFRRSFTGWNFFKFAGASYSRNCSGKRSYWIACRVCKLFCWACCDFAWKGSSLEFMKSYVNYPEICLFGIWITGQPKLWQVAAYYILFAGAVWILTQKGKRERKNNCFRSCMSGHIYSYMA